MFRSILLILSGNAMASILTLARSLIVARLISTEDYGIAATFAMSMAIVDMLSAFGLQQQIIQAKDGDTPHLQAALQAFQALRGCISGSVMLVFAYPFAWFMNLEDMVWAYQLMAFVPVMNGLVHFDIYRKNRALVYLPGILTVLVPAAVSLIMVWPLAVIFSDYRVMLYALLAQSALSLITSHLVAERRYRLVFDREIIAKSMKFGWPLLINNILMFAVFSGEKLIIGRELGMVALAIFAMGFTLTLTPTLVMAKSAQSFFLPQLSAVQDKSERFAPLAMVMLQVALLNGVILVAAVVFIGEPIIHLLLGAKYDALLPLLGSLAILQAIRVFKAGGSVVALARGRTGNAMMSNLFRVASLPLSWYVAASGGDLIWVILIAIAAEFGGLCMSYFLVQSQLGLSLRPMVKTFLAVAAVLIFAALHAVYPKVATFGAFPRWWLALAVGGALILTILSMTEFRRYFMARTLTKFDD